MKVYHGSYLEIEAIDLEKCEPYRDFGKGFYVTNIREQAEYWAERKGRICLCTQRSLQAIERIKKKRFLNPTDDAITTSLVDDYGMTTEKAVDTYFESQTYKQLTDETTALYQKPWTEIYELLKKELNR